MVERESEEVTIRVYDHVASHLAVLEGSTIPDLHSVRDDAIVELDAVAENFKISAELVKIVETSLLLADDNVLHNNHVGQFSSLANEAALADDAALDADLLAEVGVDGGMEE